MYTRGDDDDDDDDDEFRVSLGEVSSPTWPSRLFPGTEPRKRPPEQRSPPPPRHRSGPRALNLTPPDHLGRACHIASPLAHCCRGGCWAARGRQIVWPSIQSPSSPLCAEPRGAPGADTGDKTRREGCEWWSTEEAEGEQKGGGEPL